MPKLTLPDLAGGYADANLINTAFAAIEEFSDQALTRDGAAPNSMDADLDMDSNRIINVAPGVNGNDAATVGQLDAAASGLVRQIIETQVLSPGQDDVVFTTLQYTPGANNLAIYRDKLRETVGVDYTETSPTTISFTNALGGVATLTAITNEYLGTVSVPVVSVAWSSLTGVPSFASRWPTYAEVTDKPSLAAAVHTHATGDVTLQPGGTSFADSARGVFVQASMPTASRAGDLWFW